MNFNHRKIKGKGQSLVEMALISPILFTLFFIIIDSGYWIFCYGTIYNSVRRASEQGALVPPHPSNIVGSPNLQDPCVAAIYDAATDQAFFYTGSKYDFAATGIRIRYPEQVRPDGTKVAENSVDLLDPGFGQIEIRIRATNAFLTPLPQAMGMGEEFTIEAISRRTIESKGGFDPNSTTGIACNPKSS